MTRPVTPAELAQLSRLDRLMVAGLEVWAHHGVFAAERRDGQLFRIDLTWWLDLSAAGVSDDLADTTDYGRVARDAIDLVSGQPVDLIETVAARVADALLARYPMTYVQVSLHKPQAPLAVTFDDVVVTTSIRARDPVSRRVVFSLGSNLEPRWSYLQFAVSALAATPGLSGLRVSPVYQTAAVGDPPQPDFLNAVVLADSALSARDLLDRALTIEQLAHRTREIVHGPRTLDIDLIAVGDETSHDPALTLPHPRAHERAFVLQPWYDLDPAACLSGHNVGYWLRHTTDQVVDPQPEPLWLAGGAATGIHPTKCPRSAAVLRGDPGGGYPSTAG